MDVGKSLLHAYSNCDPRIKFSIPESGIKKFVVLGSYFETRLTDWSLF